MALKESQKRFLRQRAHALKPVVMIGNAGLSEGVLNELDSSLEHHELIKVRVSAAERDERDALIKELCAKSCANLVQRIGHIAILYRPARKPKLKLPNKK